MNRAVVVAALFALISSASATRAEIVLRHGPGGAASLVNSSPDTAIVLMSYSITRSDQGVGLLPSGWDSFQRQGELFSETSATVEVLSEVAVTHGLLLGSGQSRSIGVSFDLRSDADGNGAIDLTDFGIWKANQGQPLQGPGVGDFDLSGIVDGDDFEILLTEMGNSAVYRFATTAIPEPTSLLLSLTSGGAMFLLICRLRRWRLT